MSGRIHRYRVLIVEDDIELASMVADFLSSNGFDVSVEDRGDTALQRIIDENPDAVLLDVNLPGGRDGFTICRIVRKNYHGAVIMLTARGEEVDEVLGLEVGADDYLAKPVRPRVLLARLHSHLRRAASDDHAPCKPILVGALVVDPAKRAAFLDGKQLELSTAEFDLLRLLADHAGQPLTRHQIYQAIHGIRYDGVDRSIDLRISRLRKKLGDDPAHPRRIKSIRGTGYQLTAEP
jgi:two-component system response regulator RstA